MNTDPIADLLTRIRNGLSAGHKTIDVPASRIKVELVKVLQEEGYIKAHETLADAAGKFQIIRITLKYDQNGDPVIHNLKRISRPGLRKYSKKVNLKPVLNGAGVSILTTSKGLMTDRKARKENLGGEILCQVI